MTKKKAQSAGAVLLLWVILLLIRMVNNIPWWSFLIPVFALGCFFGWKKWKGPAFLIGFFAGFSFWTGSYLFFHLYYTGAVLSKPGLLPLPLVLLISGLIGGLTTGLALYTGKSMFFHQKIKLTL